MAVAFEETRQDLKPASNLHRRNLMVCATCKHWCNVDGFGYCVRLRGYECDVGDMGQYFHLCDGWA